MHTVTAHRRRPAGSISDAEWGARVDLAACYCAAAHFGWNETIYNHFTTRVPGDPDVFLVKRHGDLFDEVTASSLVKVDMQGRPLSLDDGINPAAFAIHTAILGSRPDANATLHLHTSAGIALSARPEGFMFLNQESAFFHDRISYFRFDGIEDRPEDNAQLASALAPHHHTLILRNHGLAVAGSSVQTAFVRMQYLLTCAQAQLLATGQATLPDQLGPSVCEFTRDQFEALERKTAFNPEWQAVRRLLDRHLPGYAD